MALEGLGDALFWLEEFDPSIERRTRACTLYQEAGNACRAARAAIWLAMSYFSALGNLAAGNGWLKRAERLLGDAGPCAERGWLVQVRGRMTPDAATAVDLSREALVIARQHGDLDLEVWALSEQGRGLVSLGEVEGGMALLDEAVAAATAGGRNLIIVGDACCNMLSACDRAADFARALQWCQVVDTFARRYNSVPIFHYCRVVYCGVLIATGRWVEAERELQAALRAVEQKYPTEKVHSSSRLTLLCVRQGRLEQASQFLVGFETHGVAAEASAALHLARGQAALAAAVLERRLDALGDGLPAAPCSDWSKSVWLSASSRRLGRQRHDWQSSRTARRIRRFTRTRACRRPVSRSRRAACPTRFWSRPACASTHQGCRSIRLSPVWSGHACSSLPTARLRRKKPGWRCPCSNAWALGLTPTARRRCYGNWVPAAGPALASTAF